MSNLEIKEECERQYNNIKMAEDKLRMLRAICKHDEIFIGNYSFRPGAIFQTKICSYCNKPIDGDINV